MSCEAPAVADVPGVGRAGRTRGGFRTGLAWDALAMDDAHRALLKSLARLGAAPDDQFAAGFRILLGTLERDFRHEEDLMERIGFAALRKHRDQHACVLASLREVEPHVMLGDVAAGRAVAKLLMHWFLVHLAGMDLALAGALDRCSLGTALPVL